MSIFSLPRFIRRFIRRNTHKISELQALSSRKKLSIIYTIITWHLFGYIIYKIVKHKKSDIGEAEPVKKRWWEGHVYGMDKTNVKRYRVEGFNLKEVKENPEEGKTQEEEEELS